MQLWTMELDCWASKKKKNGLKCVRPSMWPRDKQVDGQGHELHKFGPIKTKSYDNELWVILTRQTLP